MTLELQREVRAHRESEPETMESFKQIDPCKTIRLPQT